MLAEALTPAIHAVDRLLLQWQSTPTAWQQLLQQAFGRSAPFELSAISLEILDSQTMAGLRGAYTASDPKGEERIYLNANWLKTATAPELEAVLLEEIGHAIDHRLNSDRDTPGDEGAIFSALIQNRQINPSEFNQNDHLELLISGKKIKIEASSITNPTPVASITDGEGGFDVLTAATSVTTVVIGGSTYALVTSYDDNGLQIVDISNPAAPTAVASITDGEGGFDELAGASSVTTVVIGGSTYALVASQLANGLQIVDISNPAAPTAVASITDGEGGFDQLGGATGVTTVVIGDSTYALVTALVDDGLQIVDISNPAAPTAVITIPITEGEGGFDELDGSFGVTTVVIGGSTYALVAAYQDDGLQIVDISNPATPMAVASITDGEGGFDVLEGAFRVTTVVIGGSTYALVTALDDNGLQIVDISNPAAPTAVASITDGEGGFDELAGASSVTTVVIGGSTYALVTSYDDNGLQIVDISNPAAPTAVASITDGEGGFDELAGASSVTTVVIGGSTYALVTSYNDNGLQIVDINTSPPTLTSATYDASSNTLIVASNNLAPKPGPLNDIDISKITLTGEGGSSYTLTSADVEIDSATQFTLNLNAADSLQIAGLLNKNGTSSGGGSTYNIAATSGWNPGASSSPADTTGNAITVSNVTAPTLSSATYNDATGILTVTGSNLPAYFGSNNDIDSSKLTITGGSNGTYALTSSDVELTSATSFSITLNSSDQTQLDSLLNKNGTSSSTGTTYNLAAADNWAPGADASVNIADATGNVITVSNFVNVAPSATDKTITINEDSSYTFTASDFEFSNSNGNALSAVIISTLPAAGGLKLDGNAVTANDSIAIADINASKLIFTPDSNGNGSGYSSFTFQVKDDGGTTDPSANTITIDVNAVNDAPTGSVTISGTAKQGQTLTAANTLADADGLGTITNQWNKAGAAIAGATSTSYELVQADVGSAISVTASYIDGQGTAESVTSSETPAVKALPVSVFVPPSGQVENQQVDETLPFSEFDNVAIGLTNFTYRMLGGNDVLEVLGGDNNFANGNQGDDRFVLRAGQKGQYLGGKGADTFEVFGGIDAYTNGQKGADQIIVLGGLGRYLGGDDDDSIEVVAANSGSSVNGNRGEDTIIGSVADVTYRGGKDADLMIVSQGDVYGDKGADTFRGVKGEGYAVIQDYTIGEDLVEIGIQGSWSTLDSGLMFTDDSGDQIMLLVGINNIEQVTLV